MKNFGSKQGVLWLGISKSVKNSGETKGKFPYGITCPELGKKNSSLCFLILVLIPSTINYS